MRDASRRALGRAGRVAQGFSLWRREIKRGAGGAAARRGAGRRFARGMTRAAGIGRSNQMESPKRNPGND